MTVANTVAYYDTATVATVKKFCSTSTWSAGHGSNYKCKKVYRIFFQGLPKLRPVARFIRDNGLIQNGWKIKNFPQNSSSMGRSYKAFFLVT